MELVISKELYLDEESFLQRFENTSIQAGHLRSQITIELCQERLPAKSFELTSMKYGSTANGHGVVTRRSNFENNGKNGQINQTNFGNFLNHTSGTKNRNSVHIFTQFGTER
jgi:hypothetical protein